MDRTYPCVPSITRAWNSFRVPVLQRATVTLQPAGPALPAKPVQLRYQQQHNHRWHKTGTSESYTFFTLDKMASRWKPERCRLAIKVRACFPSHYGDLGVNGVPAPSLLPFEEPSDLKCNIF